MKMQTIPFSPVEYEEEGRKRHDDFTVTVACSMPALNYIGQFVTLQHSYNMYNLKETLQLNLYVQYDLHICM